MALASIKNAPKAARPQTAKIDLSAIGLEGSLEFREPRVADVFAPNELRNRARILSPQLTEADEHLESTLLMMVRCYIPEPEEKDDPLRVFCSLLNNNFEVFVGVMGLFGAAFPFSLGAAKEQAKNGSAQ